MGSRTGSTARAAVNPKHPARERRRVEGPGVLTSSYHPHSSWQHMLLQVNRPFLMRQDLGWLWLW